MIDMGMGQQYTYNWETQLMRLLHNRLRLATHDGVDQRKAIILAYEVAVDGAKLGQLNKMVAESGHFHDLMYPLY